MTDQPIILVSATPNAPTGCLNFVTTRFERSIDCALGRSGIGVKQSEGDGVTPVGTFILREIWYRPDRVSKDTEISQAQLPLRVITQNDGWSDDPNDPDYNKHVELPHGFGHECLWREDNQYDIIIVVGFNDAPVQVGLGSAIFFHLSKPDLGPTEGCIAIPRDEMLALIPHLRFGQRISFSLKT
jgi:L,D-peptidoglycan transpeptidase YkuD (ErfK/YbiS/YcfS/YnhG family)